MKKKTKIILISSIAGGVVVASLAGLIITGATIGWGPFQGLYWPTEVNRVKKAYPYSEQNKNGIVFYGASNFRLWKEMNNDLSEYRIVNAGFGGSTDKLLSKYASELLYPYEPQIVFFQTGSNDYVDMNGSDDEKVNACIDYKKEMFATFHNKLPNAKFVIMSGLLLPKRSQYTSLTLKVNEELNKYADSLDYVYFVNANEMTFDGANYKSELFINDGIHLNHDGQLLWCNNYIKPQIESLIAEYPALESVRK